VLSNPLDNFFQLHEQLIGLAFIMQTEGHFHNNVQIDSFRDFCDSSKRESRSFLIRAIFFLSGIWVRSNKAKARAYLEQSENGQFLRYLKNKQ
jgi:hypothetical protein